MPNGGRASTETRSAQTPEYSEIQHVPCLPVLPVRYSSSALCSLLVSFCKRLKLWHGKTTGEVLGLVKMDGWGFSDEKAIN